MGKWAAKLGKWGQGLALVILFCIPIWMARSENPSLLEDSDTKVLLHHIRERQDPLSWFTGDWPLGNHFYRPVSTLSFELDHALYGSQAAGYGQTNALIAIACVLLLFWLLREMTDRIEVALPGAVLFVLWNTDSATRLSTLVGWIGWGALLLMLLPGRRWKTVAIAGLATLFLAHEISGIMPLQFRMIEWLPGRTASVMTLFALLSLAAYARYERQSASMDPKPAPGALDPPATKGTALRGAVSRWSWVWAAVSALGLALALGSYEQAVIVPALLFGVALYLRLNRYRVRWAWHGAFWALLVGYLALRHQLVPSDVSGYQAQQFRSGAGVWQSIIGYAVPAAPSSWNTFVSFDIPILFDAGGVVGLLYNFPYTSILNLLTNYAAVMASWPDWRLPLATWTMSTIAFLPMAWLKHFDHYHYLPMAMRAAFVAALAGVVVKALVSAASRPAIPAPPRLDPAPGSLPHR